MDFCYLCKYFNYNNEGEPCRYCAGSSKFIPVNYFGILATSDPIMLAKLLLMFIKLPINRTLYDVLQWLYSVPNEDILKQWEETYNGEEE